MKRRPPRRSWWSPTAFPAAHLRRLLGIPARVAALTIAGALLAVSCGSANPAALQDLPGTTRQQLIADRNDPAVMLILTEYKATLSVPTLGYNDGALQALANQVGAEAESGQIGSDQKAIYDAFVAGIAQNPGAYFISTQPVVQQNVTLDYQCTGSIVTPDGYIVTAAHCTKAAPDELQQGYVQQGLKPMLDAAVQKFLTDNPGFDSDQQQKLSNAVAAYLSSQAQLANQSEALAGAMFSNTSSGDRQAVGKPLSLVSQGAAPTSSKGPFGDKDVSILKLDGYSNLPTLPVGSDATTDTGQQLYVDGYPAAADESTLQNLGTPTLSAGSISSKKTSDQGVPLIETTAATSGGNSGGPGFDENGVMVGIVSYGSSTNGASYNYLIGGSVVDEFLHEKNIQARQSTTTSIYDTALNDYYRHYYKRALPEFQQVKGLDPSHPYVDSFVQKTQTAISQGGDQTPVLDTTTLLIVIVAAVALVVVPGGGLTFFLIRRRKRSRQVPQAYAAPTMSQPQPATWGPQAPTYQPQGPAPSPQPQPQAPPFQQPGFYPAPPAGPTPQGYAAPNAAPVAAPQIPTPGIGFAPPPAPPTVDAGQPDAVAPPVPPAFTPPPGWAWDGARWVPTGRSTGDPSAD